MRTPDTLLRAWTSYVPRTMDKPSETLMRLGIVRFNSRGPKYGAPTQQIRLGNNMSCSIHGDNVAFNLLRRVC